jgi:CTP synthase (UTP-ammonia lyase)
VKIALIGDYDAGVTARRAIPGALDIAAHRFFIGTACQPEPRSREEKLSPVVAAAVSAAL